MAQPRRELSSKAESLKVSALTIARPLWQKAVAGACAGPTLPKRAGAESTRTSFAQWIAALRKTAAAQDVTRETYTRITCGALPGTAGLKGDCNSPEFFQRKVGMQPADGYAGVKLLGRLRPGS